MRKRAQAAFEPTRSAGLERLQAFLPNAGKRYAARRDDDLGPKDRSNVSTLSPWIRRRLVSEEEVARAVLKRHSLGDAAKFIQELGWRTYWKGWLEMRPSVWADYLDAVDARRIEAGDDKEMSARLAAAMEGRTGLEPFDAWVRELVDIGYLHNHARMWFASIWVYTLGLPWELGADFFLRHLIDGDPASNTLSWRWVCGLHTPGKTYLARADNITKHSGGRFEILTDAVADAAPPLPAAPNPDPAPLWIGDDTPDARFGLLLTEEDLDPLALDPAMERAVGVAGAVFADAASPDGLSDKAKAFAEGAMDDALARTARALSVKSVKLKPPILQAVADWAGELELEAVVAPYAPVGPAHEALDEISDALDAGGISLLRVVRSWDEAFWPHATSGYFRLSEKIPETLARLGFNVDPDDARAFAGVSSRR